MALQLSVYVKNVISFLYKPTTRLNSDIWNLFWRNFQFWPMFYCELGMGAKNGRNFLRPAPQTGLSLSL